MAKQDSSSEIFFLPRTILAIDLKSYYASVEANDRNYDPLTTNLVVADPTRTEKTICLAVSPSLKAYGISGRARLFEVVERVKQVNAERLKSAIRLGVAVKDPETGKLRLSSPSFDAEALAADPSLELSYIVAPPRMKLYEKISTQIFGIYSKYISADDIHVYSIDECFLDVTAYLNTYHLTAHELAMTMIREVLYTTGITATVGIGTNLYLAKVAMDIVAKKAPADQDGVRIAELDERSYCEQLWKHTPLTDFWGLGSGKAKRLMDAHLYCMGDIALRSMKDEEFFYRCFGIDGEILIDHAWGIEPVTMEDIKSYKTNANSLSNGQVLPRPYRYDESRVVFQEMLELLCADLFSKNLTTPALTWWVSYDYKSLEEHPLYSGPVKLDFYGRLHPCHSNGTVRLRTRTNALSVIAQAVLDSFDKKTDHALFFRRLGICAEDVQPDNSTYQLDLFSDYDAHQKERKLEGAMLEVRKKYGANSLLKGLNYREGATAIERNTQIGGHRA